VSGLTPFLGYGPASFEADLDMTDRKAQKRRLERAGFIHVSGWVPENMARNMLVDIEMSRLEVEKVMAEPAKPRGRPPKP
jgi:hypothetical protein